jgi:general secretion pathway protein D
MRAGRGRNAARVAALLIVALLQVACAGHWAYRQGRSAAKKGNWDRAVARLTKAVAASPENVRYRIELDHARANAGHEHAVRARELDAAGKLDEAAEEMGIAAKFDPGNQAVADELRTLRARLRQRDEEQRSEREAEEARKRALAARYPVPRLSPRSEKPIALKWENSSLQKILETLGTLAGVNVLFEPEFKDKQVSVKLSGVTFQDALEQITNVNRLFYRVVDQNTLLIIQDTVQKRKAYDDAVLRTFYLGNVGDEKVFNSMSTAITKLAGIQKSYPDPGLGAITVVGSPDKLAIAEKVILDHDKPRGEVMIEVQIIEVNRDKAKQYGIELSNYSAGGAFAPFSDEVGTTTSMRAHLLSSLNLSDFIVTIPSSLLAHFLENESTARLLASPRIRAAENEEATLKIQEKVPIPQTTFTSYSVSGGNTGASPYTPVTSFNYQDVGFSIKVKARISANDEVALSLEAEFSSIGSDRNVGTEGNALMIPTILTRSVKGSTRLKDGETSLIGGLLQSTDKEKMEGLLGLPRIPILNQLLTSNTRSHQETEMLISLTPHIIRAPRITDEDRKALLVGTEDVPKVKGARPPLLGLQDEAARATPEPTPAETRRSRPPTPTPIAPLSAPPPAPTPAAGPPPESPGPEGPPGGAAIVAPPAAPAIEPTPALPAIAAAVPTPAPRAEASTDALVSPPQLTLATGASGTLSLILRRARAFSAVEMDLVVDSNTLEVLNVTPGALLTMGGRSVATSLVKGEAGRQRARLALPPDARAEGYGAIALITVRGSAPGAAALRVEGLRLTGEGGGEIPPPPPVQVVVGPVPGRPGGR